MTGYKEAFAISAQCGWGCAQGRAGALCLVVGGWDVPVCNPSYGRFGGPSVVIQYLHVEASHTITTALVLMILPLIPYYLSCFASLSRRQCVVV